MSKLKDIGNGALYQDKQGYLTASINLNGKQHLKRVKSEEQAKHWILSMELERDTSATLTSKQLTDAANALSLLKESSIDVSLTAIAQFYLKNGCFNRTPLNEALAEYLKRTEARVAPHTLKGYAAILRRFLHDVDPDAAVASFKRRDALHWLDQWRDRPASWLGNQRVLSKFFSDCVNLELTRENPFSNLGKPRLPPPKRQFLSVEMTKRALKSIHQRAPHLIHFLTLGLFAGLRPTETLRLQLHHINLRTNYIHLSGDIVKSHSFKERVVPINDTLKAWIERFPMKEKPVPVNDICYIDKTLKDCSILDEWERTPDNLRHSFATYQFALTGNSAETAMICGHSEAIAMNHYRGRVTKEDALAYFSILPVSVGA